MENSEELFPCTSYSQRIARKWSKTSLERDHSLWPFLLNDAREGRGRWLSITVSSLTAEVQSLGTMLVCSEHLGPVYPWKTGELPGSSWATYPGVGNMADVVRGFASQQGRRREPAPENSLPPSTHVLWACDLPPTQRPIIKIFILYFYGYECFGLHVCCVYQMPAWCPQRSKQGLGFSWDRSYRWL